MGYNNLFIIRIFYWNVEFKGGLGCNVELGSYSELGFEMCTNRPSLSLKNEISRNIVGVPEGAPGILVILGYSINITFRLH